MNTNFVTINKMAELTGYTEDAIRSKINRGVWLEDDVWKRAPDNRILISIKGFHRWVEGGGADNDED